ARAKKEQRFTGSKEWKNFRGPGAVENRERTKGNQAAVRNRIKRGQLVERHGMVKGNVVEIKLLAEHFEIFALGAVSHKEEVDIGTRLQQLCCVQHVVETVCESLSARVKHNFLATKAQLFL